MSPDLLATKIVGVTGGGGHLGKAIAIALADWGATVHICGRSVESLAKTKAEGSGTIACHKCDISNGDEVDLYLDQMEQIDGFVNNAYAGGMARFLTGDPREIEDTVTNGLTNVINVTHKVARRMILNRGGSIVNISSMYGRVSPDPDMYEGAREFHNPPAYGAAKAGVSQFTRYSACHLGRRNIRVNAVSPGPFPGPRAQEHCAFMEALAKKSPMGRVGEPEELCGLIGFLLSDYASYITGADIPVDGGWTAW